MASDADWAANARELARLLMIQARERSSPAGAEAAKEIARIKTEMCATLRAEQAVPPPDGDMQ